jgi:peptide/nickel transport system substrate-binding protein
MKKLLDLLLIFVVMIGTVSVLGCVDVSGKAKSIDTVASDGLIAAVGTHLGEPQDGFNPITGWGCDHEPLIQSTLFKRDSNAVVINDLATGYTISEDGLTWTVDIMDGVKFHDGVPLTARDVAFTFNTAANAVTVVDLTMLEKATAIDDNTIEFKLYEPRSIFIHRLIEMGIVPEHSYTGAYGQSPIGSGPYIFKQWDKGQQLILEANPGYYGQEPYFKKLTILFITGDTAFAAAKAGKVDIAEIPSSLADKNVDGMKIVSLDSISARGVSFPFEPNTGKKTPHGHPLGNDVTSDIAIRKALNIGIDRQVLVDGPLNGHGQPEFSGVDKLPWGSREAIFEDGNIDEARRILREAGWVDTDGDGIVEKNGVKAEFTLLYPASAQERQALALSISEQAKKMGISIKPEGGSWDKINALAPSTPVIWGWGKLDSSDLYFRYHSESYDPANWNNVIKYNNSKVDQYIEIAMTSPDQDVANENWQLAAWDGQTGFSQNGDAAWMWLATVNCVYLVNEDMDIGTPLIQPFGSDILGNVVEWKRI